MLSNFIICIRAILPLICYLIIGAGAKSAGLIRAEEVHRFNHLVFVLFFPPLMFENLYTADLGTAFHPKLVIYGVTCLLLTVLVSVPLVRRIEPSRNSQGAMIQGIFRSNLVLMGLPISMNIFGKGNVGTTAAFIMVIVPMFNMLAVIVLESYRGGRTDLKSMVKKILLNPLIVGAAAGIIVKLLGITLPEVLQQVLSAMSDATTPITLILLGASFELKRVKDRRRSLAFVVAARLLVVPAIGLSVAALLGFRGVDFVSLLVMLAAPAAVSSYTMAESMGSDGELAGHIVIFSTLLSCFTLFLWLYIFKSLGVF